MTEVSTIKVNDGCSIAFEYHERGGAPALVLSPSLGTSMALFDAQFEAFAAHFSILRYDLRGHGQSDVPVGTYSLDRLGQDVVDLLDALEIESCVFAGVSIGGMVGQWLGYRAAERLDKLILANSSPYMGPPSGWSERIKGVLASGMKPMVDPVVERWFTPAFRNGSPTDVSRIADILASTDARGYAGCCAAIRDMDMRSILPLIEVPTLVIGGAHDPATPPEHAQILADNIANAKHVELATAHLGNVELPDQFNTTVLRFLGVI